MLGGQAANCVEFEPGHLELPGSDVDSGLEEPADDPGSEVPPLDNGVCLLLLDLSTGVVDVQPEVIPR